jgi:transcriptional antiterminator RfaH
VDCTSGSGSATENIRAGDRPIAEIGGRWWVLQTKARHEKTFACELRELGIDHFLPLVSVPRTYGRRRVHVQLPLFPGYVFVAFAFDEDRIHSLRTQRVARTLPVDDQERLRGELENIRRALILGERVRLYPGIKIGRKCRVVAGPLKGLEGTVVRRNKKGRIYLEVATLGQSAMADVELMHLEAVE